jgi:hypothetical protein
MASVKALNSISNFAKRQFEAKPEFDDGNQPASIQEPPLETAS